MSVTTGMINDGIEQYSMESDYGTEVMCAGWNPAVDLLGQQHLPVATERQVGMSAAITERFLAKVYAYQR